MSKKQNKLMGRRREKDHSVKIEDGARSPIINEPYRHVVRVGDKFAKRDLDKNTPRFVLADTEFKFNSVVMANEAMNYFASIGKKATISYSY